MAEVGVDGVGDRVGVVDQDALERVEVGPALLDAGIRMREIGGALQLEDALRLVLDDSSGGAERSGPWCPPGEILPPAAVESAAEAKAPGLHRELPSDDRVSPRTPNPTIDRLIEVPGRGPLRVRDIPGPRDDAPAVLLLHGLGATARLNWGRCSGRSPRTSGC